MARNWSEHLALLNRMFFANLRSSIQKYFKLDFKPGRPGINQNVRTLQMFHAGLSLYFDCLHRKK